MTAAEAWRRGVADGAARLRLLADAAERSGAAERAEHFRLAARHLDFAIPPADVAAAEDSRWEPENFAPLVDGVEYLRPD